MVFSSELDPDPAGLRNWLLSIHLWKYMVILIIMRIIYKSKKPKKQRRPQSDSLDIAPIQPKINPSPDVLPPELITEVQSYLDIFNLYKCRRVNSEWANVAAIEIQKQMIDFDAQFRDGFIPYRATKEDIADSKNIAEADFYAFNLIQFHSYESTYRMKFHFQDLVTSKLMHKKILDVQPRNLKQIYTEDEIKAKNFSFLLKLQFRYLEYQLKFPGYPFTAPLTVENFPANNIPLVTGTDYEALFDIHKGIVYNIRALKVPETIFGLFPSHKEQIDGLVKFVFGAPLLLADLWTNFPLIFGIMTALIGIYVTGFNLFWTVPKLGRYYIPIIIGILIFNPWAPYEFLKFIAVLVIGYYLQEFYWKVYGNIHTAEKGKVIIAALFVLECIYINNNLSLFIEAVASGTIIQTWLYYSVLYLLFASHMWLYTRVQPNVANFTLFCRSYAVLFVYLFYHPY